MHICLYTEYIITFLVWVRWHSVRNCSNWYLEERHHRRKAITQNPSGHLRSLFFRFRFYWKDELCLPSAVNRRDTVDLRWRNEPESKVCGLFTSCPCFQEQKQLATSIGHDGLRGELIWRKSTRWNTSVSSRRFIAPNRTKQWGIHFCVSSQSVSFIHL